MNNLELNTIGKRMAYRMLVLDLNLTQLAGKLARSRQTVSLWVNDKVVPDKLFLPSIGRVLGCSLEWLLTGRDEPFRTSESEPRNQ